MVEDSETLDEVFVLLQKKILILKQKPFFPLTKDAASLCYLWFSKALTVLSFD